MSMYKFKRLINKYSTEIIVYSISPGQWVGGKYVEGIPSTIKKRAAVIPFDEKTIAQLGGTVKQSDRQIYSLTPYEHGDKLVHQGMKYKVDTSIDLTPYADFYRYVAKGVSSFD